LRAQDAKRMTQMYAEHAGPLLRFLVGLTGEKNAAEDLMQETMLRAWRHIGTLPTESAAVRRWLFTVGRRIAIDAVRYRHARPQEIQLAETRGTAGSDETLGTVLASSMIGAALSDLTQCQRDLLVELYVRGRSVREVAEIFGVPPGTIKSRAHYAVRALREAVAETGDEPASAARFRKVRPAA
jgi:RNA polymerase sigma-70 factor (ECF subfamily)